MRIRSGVLLILATLARPAAAVDCVVEPQRVVELRSAAPGLVQDIKVRRGDPIRAGQVLVEIDTAVERASMAVAAFRAQMEASERLAIERLVLARARAERLEGLFGERFISAQERDAAVAEAAVAAAQLDEVRESRRLAELERRRLEEQVRQKTLRAPFDGFVVERLMNPGELVGGDESGRPILRLADLGTLHIEAVLPAALWSHVRLGQEADITLPVAGVEPRTAKVIAIDRVMDPASGTFGLRLALPNPRAQLPAGVRCSVTLHGLPESLQKNLRQSSASR